MKPGRTVLAQILDYPWLVIAMTGARGDHVLKRQSERENLCHSGQRSTVDLRTRLPSRSVVQRELNLSAVIRYHSAPPPAPDLNSVSSPVPVSSNTSFANRTVTFPVRPS
jgi:hypothetical protein